MQHEQGGLFFAAVAKALGSLRRWENAIFVDDNPQKNGIFPCLRLPSISRSIAAKNKPPCSCGVFPSMAAYTQDIT